MGDTKQKAPTPMKIMPKNPTDHHPVSLLPMLYGKVNYKDMGEKGDGIMKMFITSAEIDVKSGAQTFTGEARTKKEAKKNCAMKALKAKYGVVYPKAADAIGKII